MYAYLVAAVVFLVSVGGADWKGRTDGDAITSAEYAQRDLQAATEAQIAYAGIVIRERKKEQTWAKCLWELEVNSLPRCDL